MTDRSAAGNRRVEKGMRVLPVGGERVCDRREMKAVNIPQVKSLILNKPRESVLS